MYCKMTAYEIAETIAQAHKTLISKIGENAAERFSNMTEYHDNWGGNNEKCLSPYSVRTMCMFLDAVDKFDTVPSIFLTNEGTLQLGWEDADGNEIEIDFLPDLIYYYVPRYFAYGHDLQGRISPEESDILIHNLQFVC